MPALALGRLPIWKTKFKLRSGTFSVVSGVQRFHGLPQAPHFLHMHPTVATHSGEQSCFSEAIMDDAQPLAKTATSVSLQVARATLEGEYLRSPSMPVSAYLPQPPLQVALLRFEGRYSGMHDRRDNGKHCIGWRASPVCVKLAVTSIYTPTYTSRIQGSSRTFERASRAMKAKGRPTK